MNDADLNVVEPSEPIVEAALRGFGFGEPQRAQA